MSTIFLSLTPLCPTGVRSRSFDGHRKLITPEEYPSRTVTIDVCGGARSAPNYYADGAQGPGRGRHYPLVTPFGVSIPPPQHQYIDVAELAKWSAVLERTIRVVACDRPLTRKLTIYSGSMTAGRDTRCPARGTDSRSALKTGLSSTRRPNQPSTSGSGEWLLCSAHQTDDASLNALEVPCEVCQSNNSYS